MLEENKAPERILSESFKQRHAAILFEYQANTTPETMWKLPMDNCSAKHCNFIYYRTKGYTIQS